MYRYDFSDPFGPDTRERRIWLRLLATADVHGNLFPHDYDAGRDVSCYGLARTASLIRAARAEAPNTLLFDNGDFLQGTPLSDLTARQNDGGELHPVIAAMNTLAYDAASLGNHEFNFGLPVLRAALEQANFPVTCANAVTAKGAVVTDDETLLPARLLLHRELRDANGRRHLLKIGLMGLLPPQSMVWDRYHLDGRLFVRDMVEAAAERIAELREEGADLVILLAHTGIDGAVPRKGMENAVLALARLPGVDAMIAGHSHDTFPKAGISAGCATPCIDHAAGTLSGVPTVMPGFRGSHLGVIDLLVERRRSGGWRVARHRSEARPVDPGDGRPAAPPDPMILAAARPAHDRTLALISAPLGRSARPIHSYLSHVRCDASVRLITQAQREALSAMLKGGPDEGLPVLSAGSAFRTGGRAGPADYVDIPPGPVTLRNAAGLYPFPNTLCGLRLTGAQVADWLERAASCFLQIREGGADQPLIDSAFPGHAFDMIDGVTYCIDLTRPAVYDNRGRRLHDGPGRIRQLCLDGAPLDPAAAVMLAANSFRAFGGGPYPVLPEPSYAIVSAAPVRDLLVEHIRGGGIGRLPEAPVWSFLPVKDASVVVETGPGLRAYPGEMARLGLSDMGVSPAGFLRLRLPLFAPACESAG